MLGFTIQENTTNLLYLRQPVSRMDMVGLDPTTEPPGAGAIAARTPDPTEPVTETTKHSLEGWVGR